MLQSVYEEEGTLDEMAGDFYVALVAYTVRSGHVLLVQGRETSEKQRENTIRSAWSDFKTLFWKLQFSPDLFESQREYIASNLSLIASRYCLERVETYRNAIEDTSADVSGRVDCAQSD